MSIKHIILCAAIVISVSTTPSVSKAEVPDHLSGDQTNEMLEMYKPDINIQQQMGPIVDETKPTVDDDELNCLSRNIYYESASEPEDGKVAVGIVTLNRTHDSRFASTVCGVVNQKASIRKPNKKSHVVYQFSWRGEVTRKPKVDDPRWLASQRIALALLSDSEYSDRYIKKYGDILYFHAAHIRPAWVGQKHKVVRIGAQVFYRESRKV